MKARETELPQSSLLSALERDGTCYSDCQSLDIPGPVSLTQLLHAFFSSRTFWPERQLLKIYRNTPPSDAELEAFARADAEQFSLWQSVERTDTQLLANVSHGPIWPWWAVEALSDGKTRLYFGSKLFASTLPQKLLGGSLTPAHRFYARVLLNGTARHLQHLANNSAAAAPTV